MKSHCAGATRGKDTAGTSISVRAVLRAIVLVSMALVCLLAWGCGGNDPEAMDLYPPQTLSAAEATSGAESVDGVSATTRPATGAADASAVHARVMAEHHVRTAAAAMDALTSTTTSAPQPEASAPGVQPSGPDPTTAVVLTGGQTPLTGVWSGTADRLASFLTDACPTPHFTVPASVLAGYYVRYCAEAGLRADLLWAQMVHETGYGEYGGDVQPQQNNYAGIGATGGGEPGVYFPTAEAGVMAHVAHMVAYVYPSSPVPWASAADPRFYFVDPSGAASVLADLNGRWAVPGTTYGESIEAIVRTINAGW